MRGAWKLDWKVINKGERCGAKSCGTAGRRLSKGHTPLPPMCSRGRQPRREEEIWPRRRRRRRRGTRFEEKEGGLKGKRGVGCFTLGPKMKIVLSCGLPYEGKSRALCSR